MLRYMYATTAYLIALAALIEYPHPVARGYVLSSVYHVPFVPKVLKHVYLNLSRLHELLHKCRPSSGLDRLIATPAADITLITKFIQTKVEPEDPIFSEILDLSGQPEYKKIGFQNTNPSTDIRGSGRWGLLHLRHLAKTPNFRELVVEANNTNGNWYPLALVSIRFTKHLYDNVLSNEILQGLNGEQLTACHCQLVVDFHNAWLEGQPNLMELEDFIKNFERSFVLRTINIYVGLPK